MAPPAHHTFVRCAAGTSRATRRPVKMPFVRRSCLWLAMVGLFPHTAVSRAATFTVDSTADAPDAVSSDGVCKTVAKTCTLRAAIMQANARGGAQKIILPAGTYTLTLAGADEDRAATGDLDVAS